MLDTLLSFVAPHYCCGCAKISTLLCDNCKYDIVCEPFMACVACGQAVATSNGICTRCRVPYTRAWCVAARQDYLQQLIDGFKFHNTKAAYRPLADLLHERLPELPANTRIIPIPTIASHIRKRGYDHTLLIARRFGRLRGLPVDTLLRRATNTMQRGASARQRTRQAQQAFRCGDKLNPDATYLLIDDVVTTGATIQYATKALHSAGAQQVWIASVSRQPLD